MPKYSPQPLQKAKTSGNVISGWPPRQPTKWQYKVPTGETFLEIEEIGVSGSNWFEWVNA